jgi:chromosome segregation ATPase
MSLLVISLYELKQFLQILLWIALPATLVTVIVTILVHYRRKKQIEVRIPDQTDLDQPSETNGLIENGEAYQHMLNLQKKYISEIEISHQEHSHLKEDFRKLEKKYIELIAKNGTQSLSNYSSPVFQDTFQQKENEILQLKASLLQLEETLRAEREQRKAHSAEVNKLGNLLKDMEMVATKARQVTEDQDQTFSQQLEETRERQAIERKEWLAEMDRLNLEMSKQKEDNTRLRDRLIEQDSAQDVIAEKNVQIGFLQNQLDNRIKHFHHLEYQSREDESRLRDLQSFVSNLEKETGAMKEELQSKNQEASQLQEKAALLEEKMNMALKDQTALSETLQSKSSYIEFVENSLKELEERNSLALGRVNDTQVTIDQLHEKLALETRKSCELEHKLEFSSQLLMKIYKELAKSIGAGLEQNLPEEVQNVENKPEELEYDTTTPSLEFEFVNEETAQLQN